MIRKLLKSLREYKKPTLLTIFCAVIEVVFEILIPLCMSDLLDFGIERGKMSACSLTAFNRCACSSSRCESVSRIFRKSATGYL